MNRRERRLAVLAAFAFAFALLAAAAASMTGPPPNAERGSTTYDWCDCKAGRSSVTVWPTGNRADATTVPARGNGAANVSLAWLNFTTQTASVSWSCDGGSGTHTTTVPASLGTRWWSLKVSQEKKAGLLDTCGAVTGRLKWNTFTQAPYNTTTSIPFSSFDDGFACMKIPVLLATSAGTLIAFAEARNPDCGDFSSTALVYKRSTDQGRTWGPLGELAAAAPGTHRGLCGHKPVAGNAAPVQLAAWSQHHPGRILVPHMRDNYAVWVVHSDDDGVSWSPPRPVPGVVNSTASGPDCLRNMSYFGLNLTAASSLLQWAKALGWSGPKTDPYRKWAGYMAGPWQFIGLGPPGSVQLSSTNASGHAGRVVVPGYHAYIRGLDGGGGAGAGVALPITQLYNNFALGHTMYSDDGGDTWLLGSGSGLGGGAVAGSMGANEDQIVELTNGSLLLNSRSLATGSPQQRVQSLSHDGGATFTPSRLVPELPEPFNGCQGSITRAGGGGGGNSTGAGALYLSHPNPAANHGVAPAVLRLLGANVNLTGRDHMTVWRSTDEGDTWHIHHLVDSGAAGYSSLQPAAAAAADGGGRAAAAQRVAGAGAEAGGGRLWILYEQSDRQADSLSQMAAEALIGALSVLDPDRFVLRLLADQRPGSV